MQPFGEEHAANYDNQFRNISAIRDSLQLVTRLALSSLPEDARILCVGAGTGIEVVTLAEANPGWRFHLVEPAPAMLKIASKRLAEAGIAERCEFHEGYLESLTGTGPFNGATALLVSHFLTDAEARTRFFGDIADRLVSGGTMVNADLAADRAEPGFEPLMDIWLDALRLCDMPADNAARYREMFGRDVAAHSPAEVEAMIRQAGFAPPLPVYQALLIRGWVSTRP